jgi:osmoprotectant transport system permease protein
MKKKLAFILAATILFSATAFAGCSKKDAIQLATKPMTEQFIISEIIKLLVEDNTDYSVEITKGIGGGTGNIQPAMEKGDFDMYPEYTGTAWQYVLKHEDIPSEDELFEQLLQEYKDNYGFEWVGMYGFGDQYGLAVKTDVANERGLKTYSDLGANSEGLKFGAEPDFYEREDGYDAMVETYGMDFQSTVDIDIGLKYSAINSGEVDVIDIFTTDGQLAVADVVVLEDDKGFFLPQYFGTIVRSETLEEYPGLRDALMLMEGLINEQEMTQMNYEVDINGRDEADVAAEF